jgi:hypothetical protein
MNLQVTFVIIDNLLFMSIRVVYLFIDSSNAISVIFYHLKIFQETVKCGVLARVYLAMTIKIKYAATFTNTGETTKDETIHTIVFYRSTKLLLFLMVVQYQWYN